VKDVNKKLPGWGSWGGGGAEQAKPRNKAQLAQQLNRKKQQQGKDTHKKDQQHMIVRGLMSNASKKFLVEHAPMTPEAYARTMATPIGPEFNTRNIHRDLTQPAVRAMPGVVIEPVNEEIRKEMLSTLRDKEKSRALQEETKRKVELEKLGVKRPVGKNGHYGNR
jgi:U3 small nucleolar RNA-associated protein 14